MRVDVRERGSVCVWRMRIGKPTHTKFFLTLTHTLTHPYSFSYPIFLTCPKIKQLGELDMNMYVIEVYENVHSILT